MNRPPTGSESVSEQLSTAEILELDNRELTQSERGRFLSRDSDYDGIVGYFQEVGPLDSASNGISFDGHIVYNIYLENGELIGNKSFSKYEFLPDPESERSPLSKAEILGLPTRALTLREIEKFLDIDFSVFEGCGMQVHGYFETVGSFTIEGSEDQIACNVYLKNGKLIGINSLFPKSK